MRKIKIQDESQIIMNLLSKVTCFVLNLQFLTAELNLFYLKFILWIPPPHFIMQARMALFLGIGAVSLNETFRYMDDP